MMRMDEEMIINPVLMLAISRMRENDNAETREKMVEAMVEAKFLVPCLIQMKPGTEQETQRDTTNTVVNFNMLRTQAGQTGELPEPAPVFRRFRCHCCGPASISEKDRRILW